MSEMTGESGVCEGEDAEAEVTPDEIMSFVVRKLNLPLGEVSRHVQPGGAARFDAGALRRALSVPADPGQDDDVDVSEVGLYALALEGASPASKALRRWLASEVLPSLRQRGRYVVTAAERQISYGGGGRYGPQPVRDLARERGYTNADVVSLMANVDPSNVVYGSVSGYNTWSLGHSLPGEDTLSRAELAFGVPRESLLTDEALTAVERRKRVRMTGPSRIDREI